MKYTLLLLLLLPVVVMAQDCGLKKEPDPFSAKSRLSTGFFEIPGGSLSVDASSKEIDFFFSLNGPGGKCFDESTEATITFEGGKLKSVLRNGGAMNCDGAFHLIFKNSGYTPSVLQRMSTKKVISIQLKDTGGKAILINFSPAEQEHLMKLAACVAAEAKSLQ